MSVKNLTSGDVFDETTDFVLQATGLNADWEWPDINGLHDFKRGPVYHTAAYDPNYDDYDGKRIAVIGNVSARGIAFFP
jgi:cation diffusion facilitator CzcD-associated flavoprotein CzcO